MTSPSAGIDVAGLDQHDVALAQVEGRRATVASPAVDQASWREVSLRMLAQRGRLGLAAALGHGFGEVGEQHGEPQPEASRRATKPGGRLGVALDAERVQPQRRGEDAAHLDHEHHRVAPLHAAGRASRRRLAGAGRTSEASNRVMVVLAWSEVLPSSSSRCSTTGPRASAGTVVEQRPPAPPRRAAGPTKSGPWVGNVPAVARQPLLGRQRSRRWRAPARSSAKRPNQHGQAPAAVL